ncbi:uncharacterized protein [Amphiura filiformis]|uniref:uncharacterized protein n=1 Tax=Amphiura filiformis TaxID=82378 RepID=UPI003B2170A7
MKHTCQLIVVSCLFWFELLCSLFGQSCMVSAVPAATIEYANDTYYWRLVDGNTEYEGRLEVRRNDTDWGVIDSNSLTSEDVKVACAMFGYSYGLSFDKSGITFGNGDYPVKLFAIDCDGTEESLLHCQNNGFGNAPSSRFVANSLGLHCLPGGTTLQIRFDPENDDIEHGGALQIYDGVQHWGEICSVVWDKEDADTACRQLGYPSALLVTAYPHDDNSEYLLTHPSCPRYTGIVDNLADCRYYGFEACRCVSKKKAGTVCKTNSTSSVIDVPITYRLERVVGDTFYEAGVILGMLQGDQEWHTLCFEERRMQSGAYSVAEGMCLAVYSEELSSFQVIGHAEEQDPRFATTRRSILVGSVVNYPILEMTDMITVDGPCSKYGYVTIHAVCQHTINYKTVPVSLSPAESCIDRCGYHPNNMNCRCDPECELLKDCCLDYRDVCKSTANAANGNNTSALIPHDDYKCLAASEDIPEVQVIKSCPAESRSFHFIRYKCENEPATDDSASSILQRWPVFDKQGQNFRNIFCAICNEKQNVDYHEYELWSVDAPVPSFHTNLGGFLPWGKRRRRRQIADPCVSNTDIDQADHTTDIRVGMKLRFCQPGIVGTCPWDYPIEEIAQACLEYSSHRCGFDSSFTTYKNPHCMICNYEGEPEYYRSCNPALNYAPSAFYDLSFEFADTRVNVNEADTSSCSLNYNTIMDPTSGECHHLDCPAGYALDDAGQCAFQPDRTDVRDSLHCEIKNTHLIFGGISIQAKEKTLDCVVDKLLVYRSFLGESEFSGFDKHHLKWNANDYSAWGVTLSAQDAVGEDIIRRFADKTTSNTTLAEDIALTCSVLSIEVVHTCKKYDVVNSCTFNWHHGNADEFTRIEATSLAEVYQFHDRYIIPQFLFAHSILNFDTDSNLFNRIDDLLVCGSLAIPLVDGCRRLTVGENEFTTVTLNGKGTVLIHKGIEYEHGEYILIPDGRAQVCDKRVPPSPSDEPTQEPNSSSYKFMKLDGFILKTAYMIGTLISLIGLLATIGIYLVISDLLDYHGRGILCVVVSIFVGQLVLLLTKLLNLGNLFCLILSITSHYAWLAAFNWMNIIISQLAYHFAFLKMSAVDDVSSCGEVIATNLAGWGIPILVVVVTGVLHLLGPMNEIHIRYGGDDICWIQGAVSDLLAFGVPVATSLLYCTAMSFMTRTILCKARKEATDLRGGMDWADGLCKLYQYIKIGIVLTLTWVLTYLAVHIDTIGFWSLFVCCNSALGVVIFLYVITNQRTKDAWRLQYGKKQNIQDSSINNINSEEKNKAGIGKVGAQNISTSFSTKSETIEDGKAVAADNHDSVESEEDNESLPEKVGDKAPLTEDIYQENSEKEMAASGGVINQSAELDSDEDLKK